MANQRVVDYIKAQLPRGFTLEQIKKGLVSQGWSKQEVEESAKVAFGKRDINSPDYGNTSFNQSNPQEDKQIPAGVKIIGILYYILTGIFFLGGGTIILEGGSVSIILSFISPVLSSMRVAFIILSLPLFGFAVLYFFLGRGMWKGQKWARIVAIIITLIGLVGSIVGLLSAIFLPSLSSYGSIGGTGLIRVGSILSNAIGLIISGLVSIYLLFSDKVRKAFA